MPTATPDKDEAQIRECLNKWIWALHARDLDALMVLYAPETIAFDLMPPSRVDAHHYRQNFERWFAMMPSPIEYEMHDLRIAASSDVAFSHNLGDPRPRLDALRHGDRQSRARPAPLAYCPGYGVPSLCTKRPSALALFISISEQVVRSCGLREPTSR